MNNNQEIWIPSKSRIRDRLIENLEVALQSNPYKEAAFMVWLKENADILNLLGEDYLSDIISQVAQDLHLERIEQGYAKGGQ